jgi:beta-xylosidase
MIRRCARIWQWLLVGLCVVGLTSGVALAAPGQQAPAPSGPASPDGTFFFDGFDTSTLDPGWSWVRQDAGAWSLTERPGFLRIHTQDGTLDDNTLANNILRRAAPAVDYEVSTRVEINVTQDFHEAALMLYTGDSNFVKISRIYDTLHGGSIFLVRREVGGAGVGAFFSPVIPGTVAEMRLRFVAPIVSAAYKDGSGDWVGLGQYMVGPVNTYTYVALAAHHGFPTVPPVSVTADFDFVQVAPLLKMNLPFISR